MRRRRLAAACLLLTSLISPGAFAIAQDRPPPAAVVVFDSGSNEVDATSAAAIGQVAERAKSDPAFWVSLEGYNEDQSSRELNLALGQRRLDQIERQFEVAGIPPQRIRRINYGEEHFGEAALPARRVEIRIERLRLGY